MKLLQQLDHFLLTSRAGRTMLGPLVSTVAAVLLGLSFDRQPLHVQVLLLTILVLIILRYLVWNQAFRAGASCERSTQQRSRESIRSSHR